MSKIPQGLAALEEAINKVSGDFDKAKWLKLNPGKTVRVAFLQEIDADSPYYNKDAGLALLAVEHANPKNYRAKAQCTIESEGRCFGCEMNQKHPKTGWNARTRLYVNVRVDNGVEDEYVAILSQGMSDKGIVPSLAMYAQEQGGITNSEFRMKRNGEGKSTSYTIMQIPNSEPADPSKYDLYDLDKVCTRQIPYAEQEQFYIGGGEEEQAEEPATSGRNLDW